MQFGDMTRKVFVLIFVLIFVTNNNLFAEPYLEEKALVLGTGLTNKYRTKARFTRAEENYKTHFTPSDRKIIYWITEKIGTQATGLLNEIEWYEPNGKIWFKQTRDLSYVIIPSLYKQYTDRYYLKTKNIPEGIWAVRFFWNNNLIEERYFSFGKDVPPPSKDDINELKRKINSYNKTLSICDKGESILKINSYLCSEIEKYYRIQKVFHPDFIFKPGGKIIYTLNVHKGKFLVGTIVYQFLISPDGELYDSYELPLKGPIGGGLFRKSIKLGDDKKTEIVRDGLKGLWVLKTYYVNIDQIIDTKYFYISDLKKESISIKEIEDLDNKIDENIIFANLPEKHKKTVEEYRKSNKRYIIKIAKNGMTESEILELLGEPTIIDSDRYDNATVWIYKDIEKSIAEATKTSGTDYMILHGSGGKNVGGDIIGSLVYTVISAGVGAMMANQLELVIKDHKVVAVKGNL